MVGIFGSSHIESSRLFRCELVHDFIPPNACAASGISVVEFMLLSFHRCSSKAGLSLRVALMPSHSSVGYGCYNCCIILLVACGGINSSIARWSQGIYMIPHHPCALAYS